VIYLGYRALLSNELYNSSAIALDDTDVGFIPKDMFFNILKEHPDIIIGNTKNAFY